MHFYNGVNLAPKNLAASLLKPWLGVQMKSNHLSSIGFVLVLVASLFAEAKDLRSVEVLGVRYAGSGCPQGSVQPSFSPDASQFSLLYDAFTMNVGGPHGTTDSKSCEVNIRLKVPFGYVVNVESADFRGFISIDGGVFAEHSVDHKVGSNKLATYGFGTQLFVGPRQENYMIQSQRPNIKLPKLLACLPLKKEVDLMVRTRIKMTGGEGARLGLMAVDSADGKIEQRYILSLRKCL